MLLLQEGKHYDAVLGSQAWCPITSLDSADEAYEWNMGNTRSGLSDEEQAISDDLTAAYADYINALGLTDADGTVLTLEESDDGRYQAGTYLAARAASAARTVQENRMVLLMRVLLLCATQCLHILFSGIFSSPAGT